MTELTIQFPPALLSELADAVADRLVAANGQRNEPEEWRLLDVEEAAARLGRSSRWLRQRAKDGQVPFVKLDGGALAFELDDLKSFARQRRIGDPDDGAKPPARRPQRPANTPSQAESRVRTGSTTGRSSS